MNQPALTTFCAPAKLGADGARVAQAVAVAKEAAYGVGVLGVPRDAPGGVGDGEGRLAVDGLR